MCFGQGTLITCLVDGVEKPLPIETLQKGILVKTCHSYFPIHTIQKSMIYNPAHSSRIMHRLYRVKKESFPSLTQDLILTGGHSVLMDTINISVSIGDQKYELNKTEDKTYITENKYTVMSHLLKDVDIYEKSGMFPIYHFSLENHDEYSNYGVYANNLLVESCSIRYLRDYSNMSEVEWNYK